MTRWTVLDYFLALAILSSPPESADRLATPEAWVARNTLRDLAVEWEILDPRERTVLSWYGEFPNDVRLLQQRRQDLDDAPPLLDTARLPPRPVASEWCAFNRAYRRYLENRISVDLPRSEDLREAIRETDQLYLVWDNVRDAGCEVYYCAVRRRALKRLREALGPHRYADAALPPHVPVWRFQPID
jgi:hypothetical protein